MSRLNHLLQRKLLHTIEYKEAFTVKEATYPYELESLFSYFNVQRYFHVIQLYHAHSISSHVFDK